MEKDLPELEQIGLHHICNKDSDCEVGSVCLSDTGNQTTVNPANLKICSCDTANGYTQDVVHDICSEGTGAPEVTLTLINYR